MPRRRRRVGWYELPSGQKMHGTIPPGVTGVEDRPGDKPAMTPEQRSQALDECITRVRGALAGGDRDECESLIRHVVHISVPALDTVLGFCAHWSEIMQAAKLGGFLPLHEGGIIPGSGDQLVEAGESFTPVGAEVAGVDLASDPGQLGDSEGLAETPEATDDVEQQAPKGTRRRKPKQEDSGDG
jgi:hypothetical protein